MTVLERAAFLLLLLHKNHPTLSGIKHPLTLLADSVGQEFRRDAAGTALRAARCLGPQLGRREARADLMGAGLIGRLLCWRLTVDAGCQAEHLRAASRGLSTWAGVGFLTAWPLGPKSIRHKCMEAFQSSLRSHFHPALPVKAVTKVHPRSWGGGHLGKGALERRRKLPCDDLGKTFPPGRRGGQRRRPEVGTSCVSLGTGHCAWRIWREGEGLETRSGAGRARSCAALWALEGSWDFILN